MEMLWGKIKKVTRFYYCIAAVTIVKLILMAVFSSDYEAKMFMPFVQQFIIEFTSNPYEKFYADNHFVAFPYPPLMLLIESLGGFLRFGVGDSLVWNNLLFKLPLLFFDYIGLYFLVKLYPYKRKYVGILYFASPIILYSTYMHGQLDIIPTTFFLGAIYYLFTNCRYQDILFSLFFTAALLTKLHILAAVPLILIFLITKKDKRKIIYMISSIFFIGFIVIMPFNGAVFWQSVLFNKEQALLTQVYINFVNLKLYLPILALLVVYVQAYMLRNINKDLFISFCGVLFGVFLVFLPPMPGWYVWIVPFITTFFISVEDDKYKNLYIYCLLNLFYVVYFVTAHQSGYIDLYFLSSNMSFLKCGNEIYINTSFTLLAGILMYIIYALYQYGILSNLFYKRKGSPFTIGIAGDSGSGKSTLLAIIERCFGKEKILLIEGDGDHKWERNAEMWNVYTHLNPKANFLYRQAKDIVMLKKGMVIKRVEYNHSTGKFTTEHKIKPNKYILLSGLHAFYLPQMRRVLDLKIFMDTDELLRRYWKIKRDIATRGYTKEKILEQINKRAADTEKYIIPQKKYADLIVSYFDENLEDCCDMSHEITISLKFTLSSSINLEPMIDCLSCYGIRINYDFTQDLDKQIVVFRGKSLDTHKINFKKAMSQIIPHLEELTTENSLIIDNREGLIQLMILLIISHKMRTASI